MKSTTPFRAFLRAFQADSAWFEDESEIRLQTLFTASYAAYKFRNGEKPSPNQIIETLNAFQYSDGYVRKMLGDLLNAESLAF